MNRLLAFLRGMREFRSWITWADSARTDYNDYTKLDRAYDRGRAFAHWITRHNYEE